MNVVQITPNTDERLSYRMSRRNASESATVMGVSPYQKPAQLARLKRGLTKSFTNAAMSRGHAFEAEARQWYESTVCLFGNPAVVEETPYAASLDWWEKERKIVCDFKVPASVNSDLWKMACEGICPPWYETQLQHQAALVDADELYLCVYMPELKDGKIIKVERSAKRWSEIQQAWDVFWETYMVGDLPEEVRTDEAWANAVTRYRDAKLLLDEAQERIDSIKDELIELANKQSAKGCGITLSRVEKSGSVKWAEIAKELKPSQELIQKYTGKPSVSFTINLK